MNVFNKLLSFFTGQSKQKDDFFLSKITKNYLPDQADTLSAIRELSELVKDQPDLIEIYLALGNLLRAQSEFEKAIWLRHTLLAKPNLPHHLLPKIWYELGIDYKRAGLVDRAISCLKKAQSFVGESQPIALALARIYAQINDYEQAIYYYKKLNNKIAQAHYLVELAKQNQEPKQILKLIHKALKVYPPSPEGWLALLIFYWRKDDKPSFQTTFKKALTKVNSELRTCLLEGLYQTFVQSSAEKRTGFTPILEAGIGQISPDPIANYYLGLFWMANDNVEKANHWLEKAILLKPEFWPARLTLLQLNKDKQQFQRDFQANLDFLLKYLSQQKKFVCKQCGLKRSELFFLCPKCFSWHSLQLRNSCYE